MREEKNRLIPTLIAISCFFLFLPLLSHFSSASGTDFNYRYVNFNNSVSGSPQVITSVLTGVGLETQVNGAQTPSSDIFILGYYNNSQYNHIVVILQKYNAIGQMQWYTIFGDNSHDVLPAGLTNDYYGNLFIGLRDSPNSYIYKYSSQGQHVLGFVSEANQWRSLCSDGNNVYSVEDDNPYGQVLKWSNNLTSVTGAFINFRAYFCSVGNHYGNITVNIAGLNSSGSWIVAFNPSGSYFLNEHQVPTYSGIPLGIATQTGNSTTAEWNWVYGLDNTTTPNLLWSYAWNPSNITSNPNNPIAYSFCQNGCGDSGSIFSIPFYPYYFNSQYLPPHSFAGLATPTPYAWGLVNQQQGNQSYILRVNQDGSSLQYGNQIFNLIHSATIDFFGRYVFVGTTPDQKMGVIASSNPYFIPTEPYAVNTSQGFYYTSTGTCSQAQEQSSQLQGCARCVFAGYSLMTDANHQPLPVYNWMPDSMNCLSTESCQLDNGNYGHCTTNLIYEGENSPATPSCTQARCPPMNVSQSIRGFDNYTIDCTNGREQFRFCAIDYQCNPTNPAGACIPINSTVINNNPPPLYNINSPNPIVQAFGSPYFFAFVPLLLIEVAVFYFTKNEFLSLIIFIVFNFIFATVNVIPFWIGLLDTILGIEIVMIKRDW